MNTAYTMEGRILDVASPISSSSSLPVSPSSSAHARSTRWESRTSRRQSTTPTAPAPSTGSDPWMDYLIRRDVHAPHVSAWRCLKSCLQPSVQLMVLGRVTVMNLEMGCHLRLLIGKNKICKHLSFPFKWSRKNTTQRMVGWLSGYSPRWLPKILRCWISLNHGSSRWLLKFKIEMLDFSKPRIWVLFGKQTKICLEYMVVSSCSSLHSLMLDNNSVEELNSSGGGGTGLMYT